MRRTGNILESFLKINLEEVDIHQYLKKDKITRKEYKLLVHNLM